MGESISTAILVSLIGMVTVFTILGLVVLTGKILIRVVNNFFPIEETEPPTSATIPPKIQNKSFEKSTLAAIISTIDTVTLGRGKIEKIKKIN